MTADPSKVIVTTGATAHAAQANHRDFPDAKADGETPAIAARNLIGDLTRALDSAAGDQDRAPILQAIADVQGFVDQAEASGPASGA
jgi:hypothetical protein